MRARTAGGSIRRALTGDIDSFTDQRKAMVAVLKGLIPSDVRSQLLISAEQLNEAQYKDEFEQRLDVLETLIRDVWMLSVGANSEQIVNEDLLPELKKLANDLNPPRAQ